METIRETKIFESIQDVIDQGLLGVEMTTREYTILIDTDGDTHIGIPEGTQIRVDRFTRSGGEVDQKFIQIVANGVEIRVPSTAYFLQSVQVGL